MKPAITPAEYRENLHITTVLVSAVRAIDYSAMVAAISRTETLAPILDPTAFMRKGPAMLQDKAILEIFAQAKRKLDALPWPAGTPEAACTTEAADCAGGASFDGDPSRIVLGQGVA